MQNQWYLSLHYCLFLQITNIMAFEFDSLIITGLIGGSAMSLRRNVVVASVGPVNLATEVEDGDTIDGVVLTTGDRVLLKDQVDPIENGLYDVQVSGPPLRAEDANDGAQVSGIFTVAKDGMVNGDTVWLCTSDPGADVVGTNALTWTFFGGSGTGASGALITNRFAEQMRLGRFLSPDKISSANTDAPTPWARVGSVIVSNSPVEIEAPVNGTYVVAYSGPGRMQPDNDSACQVGLFRNTPENRTEIASVTAANPVVFTTLSAHGLRVNEWVDVIGNTGIGVSSTFVVTSVPSATTFEVDFDNSSGSTAGGGIARAATTPFEIDSLSVTNPVVITVLESSHFLEVGDQLEVIGNVIPTGVYTVTDVPSSTEVEINFDNSSGSSSGGGYIQRSETIDITYFWTRQRNQSHGFSITNVVDLNAEDYVHPRVRLLDDNTDPTLVLYGNYIICYTVAPT